MADDATDEIFKAHSRKRPKWWEAADIELGIAQGNMETNEPINRKEGHIAQADLEHRNAASYRKARKFLQNQC